MIPLSLGMMLMMLMIKLMMIWLARASSKARLGSRGTRVASKGNPSDGPSRHQAAETARDLGASLERHLVVDDWVVEALLSSHSFLGIMGQSVGKEGI